MWEIYNDQVGKAETSGPHQLLQGDSDWGINLQEGYCGWCIRECLFTDWEKNRLDGPRQEIGLLCVPRALRIAPIRWPA